MQKTLKAKLSLNIFNLELDVIVNTAFLVVNPVAASVAVLPDKLPTPSGTSSANCNEK